VNKRPEVEVLEVEELELGSGSRKSGGERGGDEDGDAAVLTAELGMGTAGTAKLMEESGEV
jgi:hypothetical protein